mmetsp:Transcript_43891/g.115939  ORF Transcript_43891/g.115939 Transcript_43891/m.115939 type:complete len:94 (-) Transcript_43891:132-413(-)
MLTLWSRRWASRRTTWLAQSRTLSLSQKNFNPGTGCCRVDDDSPTAGVLWNLLRARMIGVFSLQCLGGDIEGEPNRSDGVQRGTAVPGAIGMG